MTSCHDELLKEAHAYFKSHGVLLRLAKEFLKKYRSLGHFGGFPVLKNLQPTEQSTLSAFLRRKVDANPRIGYKEFATAWEKTRFGELPPEDFLLSLVPAGFRSKKDEQLLLREKRQNLLNKLMQSHTSELASRWLSALQKGELRLSHKEYYLDEPLLEVTATTLDLLPEKYERLPFFANRATDNPHALDQDHPSGRVFLQALAFLKGESVPTDADERTRLLYSFRLIRDDILNFATVYGLTAWEEGGKEISYWRQAAENFSPLNLPFREIVRAEKILPMSGNCVYIVENSGVFSTLMDFLQEKKKRVPLLALHGQLKAASWALLDRLSENGATLLYAGDFDPEGLGIAHRLLSRYDMAELWHMGTDEYKRAVQDLPEERLKKLPSPIHRKLQSLAQEMISKKKVLYQESLIEDLTLDLSNSK